MITVTSIEYFIHEMETRMPFRYGIAEVTAMPHLFVVVTCDVDGKHARGISADGLPPKWFTKDPNTTFVEDLAAMLDVIEQAGRQAIENPPVKTVFAFWQVLYNRQSVWAEAKGYPPLLWNFGVSLVERAVIDAYCRINNVTFTKALRENLLGIQMGAIHPELVGMEPSDLLPAPKQSIHVRHTVGLGSWLTDGEISQDDRVDDGLPQSLEASLDFYELHYFKIKIQGNFEKDREWLCRIEAILNGCCGGDFWFSLDGNEQFTDGNLFKAYWQAMNVEPALAKFFERMLYVEQPFHRSVALSKSVGEMLLEWPERPLMIIDESDGSLGSARKALDLGYAGTSHKNCKGVFKGIANACLLAFLQQKDPERTLIFSGEDLINVGPVALLQDLAVMANLGLRHVERNGHHNFAGLSSFAKGLQHRIVEAHGDLYQYADGDFAKLSVTEGTIMLGSVLDAPFGLKFLPEMDDFIPLENWKRRLG